LRECPSLRQYLGIDIMVGTLTCDFQSRALAGKMTSLTFCTSTTYE